jgi:hypothetical protein
MESFAVNRLVLFCVIFWTGIIASTEPSDKYTIILSRQSHLGDHFDWNEDKSVQTHYLVATAGKSPVEYDKILKLHFEAHVVVEAVDSHGDNLRRSYEIRKCTMDSGGGTRDFLPTGSVVIAELTNGSPVFTVKGGKLSKQQSDFLSVLVPMSTTKLPSLDEQFPTHGPLEKGTKWEADAQKLVELFHGNGILVKPEDVSGEAVLLDVAGTDERQLLHVRLSVAMHHAHDELKSGILSDTRDQSSTLTLALPMNANQRPVSESSETHCQIEQAGESPDAIPFTRRVTLIIKSTTEFVDQ